MSGLLGGIANLAGALSQGNDLQQQERVKSALQQAQITRQAQQDQIAAAVRDRQAQSSLLQDRLTQAQIGDTEAQGRQRQYEVEHPKPIAPVLGSPEYLQAETALSEAKAKAEAQYGYHPPRNIDPLSPQGIAARGQVESSKAATKGAGSAAGAQVPVADMESRYGEIADAASALDRGEWKMTQGMQTREGLNYANTVDNAAGHPSITHQFLNGAVNSLGLGGDDYPKYQSLMNSTRALGDDVAKVFKGRQNEQSVLREVALSQLTPDDYGNPQVVEQKLSRLRHIIDLAKLNNPAQSAGAPEAPTAPKAGNALKAKYGLD